tara:strand:+ start:1551 stop:1754 length:204 start_codon:yes stop_codon:yes gene_type:complete
VTQEIKFPEVEVNISEIDGNAFSIIGEVKRALRGKASPEQIEEYMREAMSGDYDHVLQTTMKMVTVN